MVHYPSPSNSEKPLHFLASLSSPLNCELLENRDPVLLVFVSSKGQLRALHGTTHAITGEVRKQESFSQFLWSLLSAYILRQTKNDSP